MAMTLFDEEFDENLPSPSRLVGSESLTFLAAALPRSRLLRQLVIAVAVLLPNVTCSRTPQTTQSPSASDGWHEFQGIWVAAGTRENIPFGDGRQASTAKLEGSLALVGPSRPVAGYRAEALVLSDTATGLVGRAVWTDARGDQVFSELKGQGTSTGSHFVGTFIGGTGRYSGASGSYEFSWRFVLETEDGSLWGQSMDLNGKIRVGSAQAAHDAGGPR